MKWLKRLKLINWHYFNDETLEFGRQTLLSGRNTAGKSTVIDALQVLFIADQRQIKFNSAAHEDARRSLIKYLRGKIDDRNVVRDGDFTNYICAEFYDEKKRESFVLGVVMDVYSDDSIDDEYFILSGLKLADLELRHVAQNRWKNRDEFRRYCSNLPGRHVFERGKGSYQKALLNRMGQLRDRFFSVFVKALSFKPIQNVRDFVYQYILDEKELQLDLMKQNFEIHEKYLREMVALNERKGYLENICNQSEQYARLRDIVATQEYVIRGLKHACQVEFKEQADDAITRLTARVDQLGQELALTETKVGEAVHKAQEAYQRWQTNDKKQQAEQLEKDITNLNTKIQDGDRLLKVLRELIAQEISLLEALGEMEEDDYWQWEPGEQERLRLAAELLAGVVPAGDENWVPAEEELEELGNTGVFLAGFYDRCTKSVGRIEDKISGLAQKQQELAEQIADLENKKRPYRKELLALKKLLEERLVGRSPIWIFCEETDLLDETWRDAVEGYLHTQRFDLLVKPEMFSEALLIYEQEKWHYRIEGVGLVDTEKEQKFLGTAQTGSLAEDLVAENPVVRARVEHLLGRVMKAGNEQELRRYATAVTSTCMSYSNLVARQIPGERYAIPYIGAQAIVRQLELKRRELEQVQEQLESLADTKHRLTGWMNRLADKKPHYLNMSDQLYLPAQLRQFRSELAELAAELAGLDMSEVEEQKRAYDYWEKRHKELLEKVKAISGEKQGREMELNQKKTESCLLAAKVKEAGEFWQLWSGEYSSDLLSKAQERWREAETQRISAAGKLANWENNQKGNSTRQNQEYEELRKLRQEYNIRYTYNSDVNAGENNAYQVLLDEIKSVDIPGYEKKLAEAQRQSEEEFKAHFIYRLREAIEMARREFHELNHALRNFPFHEDRYHFEVKPSDRYRRFYDVIMDPQVVERGSLFDLTVDEKATVLHELFEKLIRGEAGELEEFTDYRNYLDFDIIVTSGENRYSFSAVLREKSGGETQTPFYIAILASFNHMYSSGKTMRLVVFDEAFNKMDEERIQASLRLIRRMNLQLVAAVPDEKMQHLAPEVSTVLVVHRTGCNCFVDMIDRGEMFGGGEGIVDEQAQIDSEEPVRVQDAFFAD